MKKKYLIIPMLSLSLAVAPIAPSFSALSTIEAQAAAMNATGKVNTSKDPLTVRKSASTSSAAIGTVAKNVTVKIVEKSGDWYKIQHGKGYGWVSAKYVKLNSTTTKATTQKETSYSANGTVNVKSGELNVRQSASTSAKVLGALKKGTAVKITAKNGSWYKIKYGNGSGWVSADYIKLQAAAPTVKFTAHNGNATVYLNSGSLNVRQSPSTTAAVIGQLYDYDKVKVTGVSTDWYKIEYKNKTAYVSADYVYLNSTNSTSNKTTQQNTTTTKPAQQPAQNTQQKPPATSTQQKPAAKPQEQTINKVCKINPKTKMPISEATYTAIGLTAYYSKTADFIYKLINVDKSIKSDQALIAGIYRCLDPKDDRRENLELMVGPFDKLSDAELYSWAWRYDPVVAEHVRGTILSQLFKLTKDQQLTRIKQMLKGR